MNSFTNRGAYLQNLTCSQKTASSVHNALYKSKVHYLQKGVHEYVFTTHTICNLISPTEGILYTIILIVIRTPRILRSLMRVVHIIIRICSFRTPWKNQTGSQRTPGHGEPIASSL